MGGRRANTYGLVSKACLFLGVDVKRFQINLGILDFNKHLICFQEKVPYRLINTRASYSQLLSVINSFLRKQAIETGKVLGAGEKIGRGLALFINLFNPEMLVLGGALAVIRDYLRLPVITAINKYSLALVNSDTQLRISRLGDKAGVLGACLNARYKVLSR